MTDMNEHDKHVDAPGNVAVPSVDLLADDPAELAKRSFALQAGEDDVAASRRLGILQETQAAAEELPVEEPPVEPLPSTYTVRQEQEQHDAWKAATLASTEQLALMATAVARQADAVRDGMAANAKAFAMRLDLFGHYVECFKSILKNAEYLDAIGQVGNQQTATKISDFALACAQKIMAVSVANPPPPVQQ